MELNKLRMEWATRLIGIFFIWHFDYSVAFAPVHFSEKQTFTITELTAADPGPQLFSVPAGFKVNHQRKKPRISH
jgi:hypothetical protein